MIQKSDAILLKRQDLRETSLFLVFYTQSFGKIYGVMKGVRGQQKGQYSSSPQLFSENEIVFYERKDKEVFTISHCDLKEFFAPLRESLEKTSYAAYFIELINSLTPTGEKNEKIFELLKNSLNLLCTDASIKRVARIFEIKLLNILGLMPWLKNCVICESPLTENTRFSLKNGGVVCQGCSVNVKDAFGILAGTVNFIEHINRLDWEKVIRIKVSQDVGRQVESLLRDFLEYHLHVRPKTMEFMRKVSN